MRKIIGAPQVLSLFIASAATAWLAAGDDASRQAVHIDVLSPPVIARQDAGDRLVFEIHATNFGSVPLTMSGVRIIDAETRSIVSELEGASLISAVALAAVRGTGNLILAPGARAIVYVDAAPTSTPRRIRHAIDFDVPGEQGVQRVRVERDTEVSVRPQPVLGPPLSGGPWVAVYDPQLERGHRRVVYAIDGRARIPGRFAVDWMKPRNASSDGYGAAVLAVADGVVVQTRDDMPARTPDQRTLSSGDATGNFIALDLGGGRYVFYEHLKPGIPVVPGQRVRRGQVIGALGSSGQATLAHLHLHVSDAPSALGAEGQPFRITAAQVLGGYASLDAFFAGRGWGPRAHLPRAGGFFPSPNLVVSFPEK